jgi:hypothetical protein
VSDASNLRDLLRTLSPKARDDLRRVLIRDQAERDATASQLMRFRDQNDQDWADVIDFLTMYPDGAAADLSDIASRNLSDELRAFFGSTPIPALSSR